MKKFLLKIAVTLLAITSLNAYANVRGFSLTELGEDIYKTDRNGKSNAQKMVDRLFDLGVRQINLHPRAVMTDPRGNEVIPKILFDNGDVVNERRNYINLMRYIKGKGMKVGIRPIFFVIDEDGNTPYEEVQTDGSLKIWWHGNIQPADPYRWFESFETFIMRYANIARLGKADEFTIGAELYSMTVGIEDQWLEHPHGFPREWLGLLRQVKGTVPATTAVMYDINFTDDAIDNDGQVTLGGELARWKYRLVDLADPTNEQWNYLADFWRELDFVGIDMYRSLASTTDQISTNQEELTVHLQRAADRYALQMDEVLFEIELAVGVEKQIILKEIGYRSVEKGFISPFAYRGSDESGLNVMHQAAAYDAIFRAFWERNWPWFNGMVWWDASVSPNLHGPTDIGFSPLDKDLTEEVIRRYFN